LPAEKSLAIRGLPLGLAHQIKLKRAVPLGQCLSWDDVEIDPRLRAVQIRRELEAMGA
jgi:predicted homoserine dehydrogenase-like protein